MKRVKRTNRDELRAEYKLSDFPGGFVRGKYANRLRKSSNIVVLTPEVAEAFPNEEAVNKALLSLIDVTQKTTRIARRSTGRVKKLRFGQLGIEATEKAMVEGTIHRKSPENFLTEVEKSLKFSYKSETRQDEKA